MGMVRRGLASGWTMTDLFQFAERQSHMGRFMRDRGMALASDAQERDAPGSTDFAYRELCLIAKTKPEVHANDLTHVVLERFNAWGSVWQKAIRNGVIERTGRVEPCVDPKKQHHNSPVYRSLICGASVAGTDAWQAAEGL